MSNALKSKVVSLRVIARSGNDEDLDGIMMRHANNASKRNTRAALNVSRREWLDEIEYND